MADPVLHVVAGPNGAGRTTLFKEVIEPATGLDWVNADDIAAGLDADESDGAYRASRLAADRRTAMISEGRSFATETVFSHTSKLDLVRETTSRGYLVTLHVVLVPEELAVARVRSRVEHGGHDVPEEKVRSRYQRLWAYVADAVELAHETFVYDNTSAAAPFRLVARFERGRLAAHAGWPPWAPDELRSLPTA